MFPSQNETFWIYTAIPTVLWWWVNDVLVAQTTIEEIFLFQIYFAQNFVVQFFLALCNLLFV